MEVTTDEEKSKVDLYFNFDVNIPNNLGMLTDIKNNCIIDHKFLPIDFTAIKFDTLFVKDTAGIISWELLNETKKLIHLIVKKREEISEGESIRFGLPMISLLVWDHGN